MVKVIEWLTERGIATDLGYRDFDRVALISASKTSVLMSDQGKNVDGEVLHALCDEYGICRKHSSAYHPEWNGTAERAIGKIKQIMRCLLADRSMPQTHWPLLLNEISFISNSLPSASTTVSPQELTYGHILRSSLEAQIDNMHMKEE